MIPKTITIVTTLADFSTSIYHPFLPEFNEYISGKRKKAERTGN